MESDYSIFSEGRWCEGFIAVGNNVELMSKSIEEAGGFANIRKAWMERLARALLAFIEEEKRKEKFINKFRMYFIR